MAGEAELPELQTEEPPPQGEGEAKALAVIESPPALSRERKQNAVIVAEDATVTYPIFFAPAKLYEGGRLGFLGAPGSGKTYAAGKVVAEALRQNIVRVVLTMDDKGRAPQFAGFERSNPGPPWSPAHHRSLAALPLVKGNLPHVVFRGDMRQGIPADGEAIARLGLNLARQDCPVIVNIDELDRVLTDGGKSWIAPSVRTVSSQGRAIGAWLVWTTQQPHRLPNEPFDQASVIAIFRLEARSVAYLDKTLRLPRDMTEIIPFLTRGQFVLWVPGTEWDGRVYKFPGPGKRSLTAE